MTLGEAYELDGATVAGFRRDGHAVVRGVASPAEVERYRPAIRRGAERLRHERRPLAERDTYGRAIPSRR